MFYHIHGCMITFIKKENNPICTLGVTCLTWSVIVVQSLHLKWSRFTYSVLSDIHCRRWTLARFSQDCNKDFEGTVYISNNISYMNFIPCNHGTKQSVNLWCMHCFTWRSWMFYCYIIVTCAPIYLVEII